MLVLLLLHILQSNPTRQEVAPSGLSTASSRPTSLASDSNPWTRTSNTVADITEISMLALVRVENKAFKNDEQSLQLKLLM